MKRTNFIYAIILATSLTQFSFADTMEYNLVEGYNWISFNMEFEDVADRIISNGLGN